MIPTVRQEDPIRGYRFARVTKLNPNFSLCGIDRAFPFDLEDTAQCCEAPSSGSWHVAPDDDCGCGFYAVAERPRLKAPQEWTGLGFVVLHCDYYGTILEHTLDFEGKPPLTVYRSEVQHVIAMEHPICLLCWERERLLGPAERWVSEMDLWIGWMPLCGRHAATRPGTEQYPLVLPGLERLEILRLAPAAGNTFFDDKGR